MKSVSKTNKLLAMIMVLSFVISYLPIGTFVDAGAVYLAISAPNPTVVNVGGTVTFTLTYSGDVASIILTNGSVMLNGFTATKTISGTGNTRTLTLTNVQGVGGGKTVTINGGTAAASGGQLANAITSTAFTIVEPDTTPPTLGISAPSPTTVYVGDTVSYTLTYADDVAVASILLSAGSIMTNGFTATKTITGTGNTREVILSNIQGTVGGNKTIIINGGTGADAAGNMTPAVTSPAFIIAEKPVVDSVPPVLAISQPSPSSIYAGETVAYTLTYTDDVGIKAITLNSNDITLTGFTATVAITGTGNTRTVTLSNVQGSVGGNKTITVAPGTASDAAGNLANRATSPQFTIVQKDVPVIDTTPPVLTISAPEPGAIYAGETIRYTLTYTDEVGIANVYLTTSNISLHGFTANISLYGTGNTRIVILTNVQGAVGGGKYITVSAGTAVDAAGNTANAATSPSFVINQKAPDNPPDWNPNPNTGKYL